MTDPLLATVRAFVDWVKCAKEPTIPRLLLRLDTLAGQMARLEDERSTFVDFDGDPPPRDYAQTYSLIESQFPTLSWYGVADPISSQPQQAMMGDSIDDLVDIVLDLEDALWWADKIGPQGAKWHLAETYRIHWEYHLRSLGFYLHALIRNA